MRQSLTGFVLAAITAMMPALVLAGNQEVVQQIAANLKNSGQLSDYKIAVKFQDGTVWLKGQVQNEQQSAAAMKVALSTPGVEHVVNDLTMGRAATDSPAAATESAAKAPAPPNAGDGMKAGRADKVAASFTPAPARSVSATESGNGSMRELPPVAGQQSRQRTVPLAYRQTAAPATPAAPAANNTGAAGPPLPMYTPGAGGGVAPARFDQPSLPNYAWPSYASYPNYAGVTYPKQYSPTAWPYIGPFYPYPQVPLGWRKVTLEWEDGWWMLDFKDTPSVWDPPIGRWY